MQLNSQISHEAAINTPVHLGNKVTENVTHSMDRATGEIVKRTDIITTPIVGMMKNAREVTNSHESLVDIRTGNILSHDTRPAYHGTS
jgi:hypothetical protein